MVFLCFWHCFLQIGLTHVAVKICDSWRFAYVSCDFSEQELYFINVTE